MKSWIVTKCRKGTGTCERFHVAAESLLEAAEAATLLIDGQWELICIEALR